MGAVTLTPSAKRDLVQIWIYIAEDNMDAADRTDERIRELCTKLAATPAIGRLRPDLGVDIRAFGTGNYVVYYLPTRRGIKVLRVAHSARDSSQLFE